MSKLIIHDVVAELVHSGNDAAIYREQNIPDWYLDQLKDERIESKNKPAGNFHRVASIPVGVVEHMQREGIDPHKAPMKDVVRWLRNHGYDKLLTSSKSL